MTTEEVLQEPKYDPNDPEWVMWKHNWSQQELEERMGAITVAEMSDGPKDMPATPQEACKVLLRDIADLIDIMADDAGCGECALMRWAIQQGYATEHRRPLAAPLPDPLLDIDDFADWHDNPGLW